MYITKVKVVVLLCNSACFAAQNRHYYFAKQALLQSIGCKKVTKLLFFALISMFLMFIFGL